MKSKLLKWIIASLTAIILIASATGIWFKYQLKKGNGAYTELINPKPFFQNYKVIGIKNVNILHPDASHFISNQNVILKNGRIESIDSLETSDTAIKFIDGTGKFLIPGLVDTHVHLKRSKNDLMLYLANGVTSVWEMFGNESHLNWRKEKQAGGISPNIFVASRKIGSRAGLKHWGAKYFGSQINFTSPAAAKKGIRKFKEKGYDAVKFGSFISPPIYDALLEEAKAQQIPALGHLSQEVGLTHLYKSNLSELAHVEEVTKNMIHDFGGMTYENTADFISYLHDNCDSVAIKLRENNIAVSTTILLMESLPKQKFDLENYLKTIELDYVNPPLIEGSRLLKGWLPGNNHYESLDIKNDPVLRPKSELWWKAYVSSIQIMTEALNDNKVLLLAGTDANATGAVPGFSLHKELESLVNAGLTNSEALYTATVAPAKWEKKKTGEIKQGYTADLVLLSANPLEDIKNTKSMEFVFSGEYYLTKSEKDKMLVEIKGVYDEVRTIELSKFK